MDGVWGTDCSMFFDTTEREDTIIPINERFNGTTITVLLDEFYHGEFLVENGQIEVNRRYIKAIVGYPYNGYIKTLPLSHPDYPNQLNYKRVVKILVNLHESSGVEIDDKYVTDRNFNEYRLGEKPKLISGVREVYTLGWGKLVSYNIDSRYPYKFHILTFTTVMDVNGLV